MNVNVNPTRTTMTQTDHAAEPASMPRVTRALCDAGLFLPELAPLLSASGAPPASSERRV